MPNSYQGQYCGGTLSYMLDSTSIITYVVSKGGDAQDDGKIYRNMFHYGANALIQGRIYPQGNDGSTDLYAKFRNFMHEEMSKMLDLGDDTWEVEGGTRACCNHSYSSGYYYRDYGHFAYCNVSYPKNSRPGVMNIGHNGICPCCGREITSSSAISHMSCMPRRGE